MGNFERLSVLVIVVVIVMILIVALVHLTNDPSEPGKDNATASALDASPTTPPAAPKEKEGVVLPQKVVAVAPTKAPTALEKALRGDPPAATKDPAGVEVAPVAPTPDENAAPKVEAAKPAEPEIYVVKEGDTIRRIVRNKYPSNQIAKATDLVLKANSTVDPARMRVGTKLTLPPLGGEIAAAPAAGPDSAKPGPQSGTGSSSIQRGGTYTTHSGDTLASIARRAYGD